VNAPKLELARLRVEVPVWFAERVRLPGFIVTVMPLGEIELVKVTVPAKFAVLVTLIVELVEDNGL
jgi:hypothetical protein